MSYIANIVAYLVQYLAHIISYLFHPILIPTYAMILLIWCNPYKFGHLFYKDLVFTGDSLFILRTTVLNSIFFPLFTITLMKMLGFINNYDVKTRNERILVYIATFIYFLSTFIAFYKLSFHEAITDVMLGSTIAVGAALFITAAFMKISAHAIGVGGLLAIVLSAINLSVRDLSFVLMATILIAGIVGTCRLLVDAHEPREVYAGYMVGFICMALVFIF